MSPYLACDTSFLRSYEDKTNGGLNNFAITQSKMVASTFMNLDDEFADTAMTFKC